MPCMPERSEMIYFFYGDDTYRLKKTVEAFTEKFGDDSLMNVSVFDGDYDLKKISLDMLSLPFLSKKRLVIVKNIFSAKSFDAKKLAEILDSVPDSTVVLFTQEGQPDKRSALFKRLTKEKSKELGLLSGAELTKWIKAEVQKAGGEIGPKESLLLAEYFGGNLWQLKNEIAKLVVYDKNIKLENIEKLSVSNINVKIFDLTDAITAGNKEKAFEILKSLLDSGENELYILSMVEWQMRNIATIYDLKDSNEFDIAKMSKMSPYTIKKILPAVRSLCHSREGGNPDESGLSVIKNYYRQIIEAENDIKTGAKEPDVALELLVNQLTN